MSGVGDILRELEHKVRELEQTARRTGQNLTVQNLEHAVAPLREEIAKLQRSAGTPGVPAADPQPGPRPGPGASAGRGWAWPAPQAGPPPWITLRS
ncbi:hypothetical protein ACFP81_05840 [Deinococcus lacus]|uniref:Uncharacterized protein n=1 Tax=Deinococcus lacus TaxID=392561 RepID=A0ABW1YBJ1_9DEIO